MGRKSLDKKRTSNPELKEKWVRELMPHLMMNGLKSYTMQDICELIGISKATLYKYFKSRDEIIEAGILMKLQDLHQFELHLKDEKRPYLERYLSALQYFIQNLAGISNELLADLQQMYPNLWQQVEIFQTYALNLLKDFYQDGMNEGILRELNPSVLVITQHASISALLDPKQLAKHDLTLQIAMADYFRLLCHGMLKPDYLSQVDVLTGINQMISDL